METSFFGSTFPPGLLPDQAAIEFKRFIEGQSGPPQYLLKIEEDLREWVDSDVDLSRKLSASDVKLIAFVAVPCFLFSPKWDTFLDDADFRSMKVISEQMARRGWKMDLRNDIRFLMGVAEWDGVKDPKRFFVVSGFPFGQEYLTALPRPKNRPMRYEFRLGLFVLDELLARRDIRYRRDKISHLVGDLTGKGISSARVDQLIRDVRKKPSRFLLLMNMLDRFLENCFPDQKKFWRKFLFGRVRQSTIGKKTLRRLTTFGRSALDGLGSAMAEIKGTEDCLDLEKKLAAIKNAIRKQRDESASDFLRLLNGAQPIGEGKPMKRQVKDPAAWSKAVSGFKESMKNAKVIIPEEIPEEKRI